MLAASATRISEMLSPQARVLDVGGWGRPFVRADWVLDVLPYETRAQYGRDGGEVENERFSEVTWVTRDICDPTPWPFENRSFDFAVCSHTLEDVRDPMRVCAELSRVAKAGYIEVPARVEELTWGIHGDWVGWAHHRWLVEMDDEGLTFLLKTHALHGREEFHLPEGFCDHLAPEERVQTLWWEGSVGARERLLIGAEPHDAYFASFVAEHLGDMQTTPGKGQGSRVSRLFGR